MKILKGAISGLIAGMIASWAMELFQEAWSSRRPLPNSGGPPATEQAADLVAEATIDRPLTEKEKPVAASAIHYAMGGGSAAVYGALGEVLPIVRLGVGLPFGAAVWLLADEIAVPAAGLSGSPLETPAETNRYAFASHLVYGFVTETVRSVIRVLI